jgi:hypothetical protein
MCGARLVPTFSDSLGIEGSDPSNRAAAANRSLIQDQWVGSGDSHLNTGGSKDCRLLLVVDACTLCWLRLRIIRVIHSGNFAVLRDNYRGINCNFSIFLGFTR